MGAMLGATVGRLMRAWGLSESGVRWVVVLSILVGMAWIVVHELRHKKTVQKAAFQGITFSDQIGVLHLVQNGAIEPKGKGLLSRLRGFESLDEVYEYVYKKFDEATFAKLVLHIPNHDIPAEFTHDPSQSDAENLERLKALSSGE